MELSGKVIIFKDEGEANIWFEIIRETKIENVKQSAMYKAQELLRHIAESNSKEVRE